MKNEVFGIFGIFGNLRFLGIPDFWNVKSQFLGVKNAKNLEFFWHFLGDPRNLGFFWDFFGIVHSLSNILMVSMYARAGSGYFFFPP